MISYGKNIRQANDPLNRIELKTVYQKIRQPKPELKSFINQLRTIAGLDATKYRQLKVKLPYLVAAVFNPNYRKKDNFASAGYFIIDIDHIHEKEMDLSGLFKRLTKDERVVMAFRSPSNDGIKLFFKFKDKCHDAGKYSLFYKHFAQKISIEYGLNQVIDKTTSDVSRACFVSFDPEAYYNEQALPIDLAEHVNFENEEVLFDIKKEIKTYENEIKEKQPDITQQNTDIDVQDLPLDMLRKIREKLNPRVREKREKQIFVPDELNDIPELIRSELDKYSIEIESVKNIHYGKQIRFKYKLYWSELNIFYGKRGYTLVKSTKNGANKELTETCYAILADLLL